MGKNLEKDLDLKDSERRETVYLKCENCGAKISAKSKFCPECGSKLNVKSFCPECGAEINGSAKFCPECGNKL